MSLSFVKSDPSNSKIAMLIGITLVLSFIYFARVIVIPIALAVLITFLLVPTVNWLERWYFSRVPAVITVTCLSLGLFLGVTFAITQQINSLIDSYPEYEENIAAKIAQYNERGRDGMLDKFHIVAERLYEQLDQAKKKTGTDLQTSKDNEISQAQPVKIVQDGSLGVSELWNIVSPVLEPLANLGLVIVLVIFMLINREDLRDRFISLVGVNQLTDTTRALEDAGERISRYLLMQLLINCGYGVAVGLGLWLIGVPYALLWGSFAALLRYIPYLGAWLSALLPIALSLLISPEWNTAFMVIALFLALELITNMVFEPLLYGRGIGVSQAALLITVAFWTWLWGPVGLILASPLTVCLAVLGRYVPFLRFLDILLGDRPTLSPVHRYYQRLLAKDEDEASDIVETHINKDSLVTALDNIVIPALTLARIDLRAGKLDEESHQAIINLSREILENQPNTFLTANELSPNTITAKSSQDARTSVLVIPARDASDELIADIFASLVDPNRFDIYKTSSSVMVSEILALIETQPPHVLVILSIPPGGIAHIRYVCKRIISHYPELRVVVGRLGLYTEDHEDNRRRLTEGTENHIVFSLTDTVSELNKLSTLD
jgi:predicted PurR-regulated permease PerM